MIKPGVLRIECRVVQYASCHVTLPKIDPTDLPSIFFTMMTLATRRQGIKAKTSATEDTSQRDDHHKGPDWPETAELPGSTP